MTGKLRSFRNQGILCYILSVFFFVCLFLPVCLLKSLSVLPVNSFL